MNRNKLISFLIALSLTGTIHAEPAFQSHEALYSEVKEYIAQSIDANDYEISIAPLDSLLKLTACPEPLEIFTARDLIKAGRNSIGVRCNTANKWSLFVTAMIRIYQPVLVLVDSLQRGETISAQHLSLERKDVSGLRGDFVTQIEQIENKQVLRPMQAGSIVSLRNITEPKLIKRGDKITISSVQSDFAIRMNGMAMMDGIKGQNIRIKNESSGRIVSATVIEAGLVSVNH